MHHDSYMAFTDVLNALHAVFDAKRLISCKFTEATVQPEKEHRFFRVVSNGGKSKAQVLYGRRGSGVHGAYFSDLQCQATKDRVRSHETQRA